MIGSATADAAASCCSVGVAAGRLRAVRARAERFGGAGTPSRFGGTASAAAGAAASVGVTRALDARACLVAGGPAAGGLSDAGWSGEGAGTGWPHMRQKLSVAGSLAPQCAQVRSLERRWPQAAQNLASADTGAAQWGQIALVGDMASSRSCMGQCSQQVGSEVVARGRRTPSAHYKHQGLAFQNRPGSRRFLA